MGLVSFVKYLSSLFRKKSYESVIVIHDPEPTHKYVVLEDKNITYILEHLKESACYGYATYFVYIWDGSHFRNSSKITHFLSDWELDSRFKGFFKDDYQLKDYLQSRSLLLDWLITRIVTN